MSPDTKQGASLRWEQRTVLIWLAATVLGAILFVLGLLIDPRRALHGYLAAYAFVWSTGLGALLLLCTVHAMGATWPVAVRRVIEAMASTMPVLALLLVPILVGMKWVYPWLAPDSFTEKHVRELVEHRLAYLNVPFFLVRALILVGVWIAIATLLRRWSLRQDVESGPLYQRRMRQLGAAALPVLGITLTIGAFDWLMSVTPEWYTSMYGIYLFAAGFLSALATLTVLARLAERNGSIPALQRSHYYALGRLLLAFTIFWAYIAYFQFFLIWIANRPSEASWYLQRVQDGWAGVSVALGVGRFAVPFMLLLLYVLKQHPWPLLVISVWMIVFHYLDCYWLVMPALRVGPMPSWMDLGGLLLVGGVTVGYAVRAASAHPLVARGDPRLAEALAYESR